MPLILHFEEKHHKKTSYECVNDPRILKKMTNSTIVIISMTSAIVLRYQTCMFATIRASYISFIASE